MYFLTPVVGREQKTQNGTIRDEEQGRGVHNYMLVWGCENETQYVIQVIHTIRNDGKWATTTSRAILRTTKV